MQPRPTKNQREAVLAQGTETRNLPKPIPERIREAREARGLLLDDFAEQVGVTKQTVAQYENGLISPSGEVMGRILAVTAQPPAFFVTPRERSVSGLQPFWRGLKRMDLNHRKRIARRLEWTRDVVTYLERYIVLPNLSLPHIEFDSKSDDPTQVELAADKLREHWSLGRGPLRDFSATMELNGFVLVRERVECPDMDAVSCWQNGRPFVLFSAEVESGPRTAYNLAHETAHVLLHADVEVTKENLGRIEKQANRFASALLLPQETFSKEVFGTSLDHFIFLKQKWGVAIAAMAYRCKDLELFSENQFTYVMKQLNARGIRKREPFDDKFQTRPPSLISESLKMLLDSGARTRSQIEEALALNLDDVESLAGLDKGFLNQNVVPFRPRLI